MAASQKGLKNNTALLSLMARARRRQSFQLFTNEAAFAIAVIAGGATLLLAVGTELIAWYSLALLLFAGIALAVYRTRRGRESEYRIAQRLDRNLQLNDALSTAIYFAQHRERRPAEEIIERQRSAAGDVARTADLRLGLPFIPSRSVYVSGALAMLAIGTFGLRYGLTRSLDLRPSLVRIAFDGFLGSKLQTADARKRPHDPRAKNPKDPIGVTTDPWQTVALDQHGAPDTVLDTIDTPDVNPPETGAAHDTKANGAQSQKSPDQQGDTPEDAERSSGGNDQAPDGSSAPTKEGGQTAKQSPDGAQKSQSAGENSSLTGKMKDALANLLSKLKMQPKNGGSQQGSQNQNGQQQNAQNRGGKEQGGSPTPGKPQGDASASPDGQSSQDAQGAQQAQNAQGKTSGKNSSDSRSQDGKSGIGKEDGDKSVKEAEQLAAMGKISEIIGKRAQNVTGEVMVEVASGKQQLRTQYTQRKASHGDSGGEISRDEVPLAYQQYVQQYFEEIRKLPPAGTTKSKGGAAPAKSDNPRKAGS